MRDSDGGQTDVRHKVRGHNIQEIHFATDSIEISLCFFTWQVPISIRFLLPLPPLLYRIFFLFRMCIKFVCVCVGVCVTLDRKTNLGNIEFALILMMKMSTWTANQGEKNNKINRDPWFFNRPESIYENTFLPALVFFSGFIFHYFFIVSWCECVHKYMYVCSMCFWPFAIFMTS